VFNTAFFYVDKTQAGKFISHVSIAGYTTTYLIIIKYKMISLPFIYRSVISRFKPHKKSPA
jgi:hypothetical protein